VRWEAAVERRLEMIDEIPAETKMVGLMFQTSVMADGNHQGLPNELNFYDRAV
jgi:hypothetical protein